MRPSSWCLLETVVGQANETVLITSAQLDRPGPEIVFVNPALCAMTGYGPEEMLHRNPRILKGPKSDRAMLQRLREALERGEPFSGETVKLPQGRRRVLRRMGHHPDPFARR